MRGGEVSVPFLAANSDVGPNSEPTEREDVSSPRDLRPGHGSEPDLNKKIWFGPIHLSGSERNLPSQVDRLPSLASSRASRQKLESRGRGTHSRPNSRL